MSYIPEAVFKCLSDETRLRTMLLIQSEGELCVCEIAAALDSSQPKVSRHMAQLRNCNLLLDTRQGQWVYYQLHPELGSWISEVLATTAQAHATQLGADLQRLAAMGDRPERLKICC